MSNIWIAAADGKLDEVRKLIESGGFTANSADPNGFTPIHAAASYGHKDLLNYLLTTCNGNVNIQDSDGDTPLHHTEDLAIAEYLIKFFGADYKIKNNDGLNVKEYCTEEGEFPELINFYNLLEKCGDINSLQNNEMENTEDSSSASAVDAIFNGQSLKFGEADVIDDNSEETKARRQQVEQIFNDETLTEEQKNEKLKEYVIGVVSDNIGVLRDENTEEESKKRKQRE